MGIDSDGRALARTLARNIQYQLEKRSMSILDCARACDKIAPGRITYRTVLRIVQDEAGVHIKYLPLLAQVLGCDPWQLLKP